ncbi:hypothetical protein D3C76_1056130 [compost metagenome]
MQAGDGAEDRGENQRHDDHLQQLYVAVTDQVEPAESGFERGIANTVDGMQGTAEQHTKHQGEQDFPGQAPSGAASLSDAQQQGCEHQHVKGQRQIH